MNRSIHPDHMNLVVSLNLVEPQQDVVSFWHQRFTIYDAHVQNRATTAIRILLIQLFKSVKCIVGTMFNQRTSTIDHRAGTAHQIVLNQAA